MKTNFYQAAQRTLDIIAMRYNFQLPTQADSSVTNFRISLMSWVADVDSTATSWPTS